VISHHGGATMDDLGEAGTNWTVANINKPRESAGGGGVSQPGTQDNTCTKPSPSSTVPYYGTLPTHGTAQRESVQCSITDVLYWLSFYHCYHQYSIGFSGIYIILQ